METINLTDFQKRKLKSFYISLYMISKEIKIRTELTIADKKLYTLIGVDARGIRQILGIYFDNINSNRVWLERFEDIKARGVEKILFFVTPKNKNIEKGIKILRDFGTVLLSYLYKKVRQENRPKISEV